MSFNPLRYPAWTLTPDYLSGLSAWVGHIPFAFMLTDMLSPAMVVELGTHAGDSYMAFCQAVQTLGLPTRCYAVDTWRGDCAHRRVRPGDPPGAAGAARPGLWDVLTLLQMTFDEALPRFADGSIDLLHIDGLHTYEAVRHDLAAWLPKMSPRGVVLLHDTAERRADFGVWRLYAEATARFPHFSFEHEHGLGLLAVGRDVPAELAPVIGPARARRRRRPRPLRRPR